MTAAQQFFMGIGFLTTLAVVVYVIHRLVARRDTYGERLEARYARRRQRKAARSED